MEVLQSSTFVIVCVLYIIFCLLVISLGIAIGIKLYNNVKNEEHNIKGKVIQRIMKTYTMVQCVAWPFFLLFSLLVMFANRTHFSESHPLLMNTVKSIWRFSFTLTCSYVGFNSLIVAICRYVFIMIVTHNDSYTIKKLRDTFLVSSILVPIAVAILHEATFPKHGSLMKGYAPDSDTTVNNTVSNFSLHGNMSNTMSNTTAGIVPQSFVFIFVDTYFPNLIKTAMKIVSSFMKFAIFSNIFEGLIYLHIYIYDRKSERQGIVSKTLSEKVRMRRQRRKTINIQMTIISWFIEFIAGIANLAIYFLYKEAVVLALLGLFNIFVNFVVIPGTYILNTEDCKRFIIEQGWIKSLRRMRHSTRVSPSQNEIQKADNQLNDVHCNKPMPQPIPTISGTISARQQKRQR